MRGFSDHVIALVLACMLLAAGMTAARSGPYEDALAHFTENSFDRTIEGVSGIVASGNALAVAVIGALQEGRLLFDTQSKRVFIRDKSDRLLDASTGQPFVGDAPADISPVRINNRLRRIIEAALGSLTLLAPEPAKRLEAAQAVFRSKDADALTALDQAIAAENDARVRQALIQARAAVVLYRDNSPDTEKIDAVTVIRQRGDQDAVGLLAGLPASATPAVKKAAVDAIASIESNLALWAGLQNAWYGLSLGSVLLLAAIGLAITFGVMGVINMAHGEMVMLGAYTAFVVQEVIRATNPALFDYSLAVAIPLAFVVAGFIGILVERSIIRFLYGRPLETLLATWGLSLILQQSVRTAFGPTNKDVGNPSWMSGAFDLGHITITYNRLWIIIFTLMIFLGLLGLLRFTRLGLRDAGGDPEQGDGGIDGHPYRPRRRAHLWARLRHRRPGRCRIVADRQCQPQSGPGLYHRFLHGCRVRRRGQSVGNVRRCVHARHC